MTNWPIRWGFLGDPEGFVGKTIEAVECGQMESMCTFTNYWFVKFTDGTRGFIGGHSTKNMSPSPSEKSLRASKIVTPEEFGQYMAEEKRQEQERQQQRAQQRRRDYERLKQEFEKSGSMPSRALPVTIVGADDGFEERPSSFVTHGAKTGRLPKRALRDEDDPDNEEGA